MLGGGIGGLAAKLRGIAGKSGGLASKISGMAGAIGDKSGLVSKANNLMGTIAGAGAGGGAGAGAGAQVERWGIVECLNWVREKIMEVIMFVQELIRYLPILKEAAIAFIVLLVLLLILLLVLYLIYVVNPRIPTISHTEDLEGFMEGHVADLISAFQTISQGDNAWLSEHFAGPTATLQSSIATVLARPDAAGDLQTYFEFRKPLLDYGWLNRSDLRNNAPQFVTDDGESLDTSDFRENVLEPMEAAVSALGDLSDAMRTSGDLRLAIGKDAWNVDKVAVATAVHAARMMLDTEHIAMINRMWSTRRKHLPMAIWTVYYLPLIDNVYKVRIPSYWEKFPKWYVQTLQDGIDWWGGVGVSITQMPCKMAYSDPAERMQKCAGGGEKFFAPPTVDAEGNPRKPDIEESFGLAAIGEALSSIGSFFINIGNMGSALANLFSQFPQDPFGSIIGLVSILIGLIFGLIFLLVFVLLTVSGIFFWYLFVYVTIYSIAAGVVYTLYLVMLTVLIAIPYFGLWMIDMPTGGFVVRTMRCEERLDAWYNQPGYAEDNGFEHMLPFCMRPCPERYVPTFGGTCCGSRDPYMPDYCPQQQIYRILRAGTSAQSSGPASFVRFKPPSGFGSMPYPAKRMLLLKAYEQKVKWYQKCYSHLTKYDYITRHLCDNVDLLGPTVDADGMLVMAVICKDCFCDYEADDLKTGVTAAMTSLGYQADAPPPSGQPSSVSDPSDPSGGAQVAAGNLSQCARLRAIAANAAAALLSAGGGPGSDLFRRAMLLAVLVICVLIALYSLLEV